MFGQPSRIYATGPMIMTNIGSELDWIEVGFHKYK